MGDPEAVPLRAAAVLIDLDGTLTDPKDGIVACLKQALSVVGAPLPAEDELERYIGPPLQASLAALLDGDAARAARALALYRERFAVSGMFENRVYPGVTDALSAMRDAGLALFVATSKPQPYAERILDHFGLAAYFHGTYGSELDGRRSDKAGLIAHLLQRESLAPSRSVMVGDRSHDMLGARSNGVVPVGVLWGYGSREELVGAGARALCGRPGDLLDVLVRTSPDRP